MHRTALRRPAAALATAAFLGLALTACGGSPEDAPTDADQEEFCDHFQSLEEMSTETPSEDEFEDQKEQILELQDIGTPEEIEGEAREGFEIFLEAIEDAEYDDVENASPNEFPGIESEEDSAKVLAFFFAAAALCSGGEIPTDFPSE